MATSWTKTVHFSSYSAALSEAQAAPAPRFVLFLGIDKETGSPWCPDVRRCAPAIRSACSGAKASLLEVDVGGRGDWRPPATHPLRSPPLSLTGIPTLLAVDAGGKEVGRIGSELEATASEEEAADVAEAFVGKFARGSHSIRSGSIACSSFVSSSSPSSRRRSCCFSASAPAPTRRRPLRSPLPALPSPPVGLARGVLRHRNESLPPLAAKKGGGGGRPKKGPSLIPKEKPPYSSVDVVMLTLLLVESYRRSMGRPLLGGGGEGEELEISSAPRALYEFPYAVLAHDRFSCAEGVEPRFTYANAAAQRVFEADSWGELVGMESRKSADQGDQAIQEDRSALLDRAASTGEAQRDYVGWRVSLRGTKFEIQDGVLFNVRSPSGENVGQAVVFGHWKYEDGTEGGPAAGDASREGGGSAPAPSPAAPSAADVEAAEAAVAGQAAAVRALKDSGKTNGDPEVASAVEELLRLKGVVARMKGE